MIVRMAQCRLSATKESTATEAGQLRDRECRALERWQDKVTLSLPNPTARDLATPGWTLNL